ncbi:hypothetical protein [Lysobacter sp. N42]|uniref:hypothetical protein n=1 Tax=Lysobacter sp. N42 TaxID=2545719 RepID=UPI0010510013|nr:hypothetical protein [Lysobacter sp. N42]TCZ80383.1 hypothetical protein EYQ95_24780 [Lysobacter sp. N42]TCZ80385.1 hypothetical protein EYQ95_24790 [Lysobacter sp. N42]
MATDIELFNQHQMDTRNRLNFLVQSVLFLAGTALTASVSVFTGSRTIKLSETLQAALAASWWALVASMCLAVVVVAIVLLRDYALGERWRRSFDDPSVDASGTPGAADVAIIVCGILSLIAFLGGFIGIGYVATSVVVA